MPGPLCPRPKIILKYLCPRYWWIKALWWSSCCSCSYSKWKELRWMKNTNLSKGKIGKPITFLFAPKHGRLVQCSAHNHPYNQRKPGHQSSPVRRICLLWGPAEQILAPNLSSDNLSLWHFLSWFEANGYFQNWHKHIIAWKIKRTNA